MQTDVIWIPRVGDLIKRRNDPDAPEHTVMGVRGGGALRTVALDAGLTRWWTSDMFELCYPPARPAPVEEVSAEQAPPSVVQIPDDGFDEA